MPSEAFLFWLIWACLWSLGTATRGLHALTLSFGLILGGALGVTLSGWDLLGVTLGLIYTSAFSCFSLLAMHFSPQPQAAAARAPFPLALWLAAGALLSFLYASHAYAPVAGLAATQAGGMWTDFYAAHGDNTAELATWHVSSLLFRAWAAEGLWLNLYILVGLAFSLAALSLLRRRLQRARGFGVAARLRLAVGGHLPTRARTATVHAFRRQTRRKNSSQTRFFGAK